MLSAMNMFRTLQPVIVMALVGLALGACGVKSFYVPRSFPEGYSVNLNCLDRTQVKSVNVEKFDGDSWESAYDRKKHAPRSC